MSEIINTAILAYVSKDAIKALLGPTFDYLGGELRNFTEFRVKQIGRIFQNAQSKLGERINSQGGVPPKVLKMIFNEGSFSDDNLLVEYFGGVLASSRTDMGRDDRGARIAKIIDSLSVYQIRTHYLIYSVAHKLFINENLKFHMDDSGKMQIFIPLNEYLKSMDFNPQEKDQLQQIMSHTFLGLGTDNLIDEDTWQYGGPEILLEKIEDVKEAGIHCQLSPPGAELFLWAFGYGDRPLEFIFNSDFMCTIEGVRNINNALIAIPKSIMKIRNINQTKSAD